jgi:hypothetical protein
MSNISLELPENAEHVVLQQGNTTLFLEVDEMEYLYDHADSLLFKLQHRIEKREAKEARDPFQKVSGDKFKVLRVFSRFDGMYSGVAENEQGLLFYFVTQDYDEPWEFFYGFKSEDYALYRAIPEKEPNLEALQLFSRSVTQGDPVFVCEDLDIPPRKPPERNWLDRAVDKALSF